MKENEIKQVKITLGIICLMQATINKIDDLSVCSAYMHQLKKKSNAQMKFLEGTLRELYSLIEPEEIDKILEKTAELEEVCNNIEIDSDK